MCDQSMALKTLGVPSLNTLRTVTPDAKDINSVYRPTRIIGDSVMAPLFT